MRASKTVRAIGAAAGTLIVGAMLAIGLSTAPAAATEDSNSGSIDTSVTSVATEEQPLAKTTGDDECSGDKCRRINWCVPIGHKPPIGIASDAPLVVLGSDKDETPTCIKKPKIDYKCCVADEHGTASVHVIVTNLHKYKMRVKVVLDDGTPVIKWVNGNDKATFVFANVANGDHTIHASVWVGGHTWCHFKEKPIKVVCASPSPSTSPSPSVTPSPSVSQTEQPPPGGELPQTGDKVLPIVGTGVGAMILGGVLFFGLRRRRDFATTTVE